jgi:hypothetical protein
MDSNTVQQIVKEATNRLTALLEDARQAEIAKEKRDIEISKTRLIIDFLDPEGRALIEEKITNGTTVNGIQLPPALPIFQNPEMPQLPEFNYDKSITWEERIKAYFKFKNRVLTIGEIVEAFKHFEPNYNEKKLKGAVTNSVAGMHKDKLLKVYNPGFKMRGYYYGNPVWFEGDQLREEYKPDLKEKLLW